MFALAHTERQLCCELLPFMIHMTCFKSYKPNLSCAEYQVIFNQIEKYEIKNLTSKPLIDSVHISFYNRDGLEKIYYLFVSLF